MHTGSLKDLDEAVKSTPYLTRLPSMFNPEHDGFYQPFSRPTREVKELKRPDIFANAKGTTIFESRSLQRYY